MFFWNTVYIYTPGTKIEKITKKKDKKTAVKISISRYSKWRYFAKWFYGTARKPHISIWLVLWTYPDTRQTTETIEVQLATKLTVVACCTQAILEAENVRYASYSSLRL